MELRALFKFKCHDFLVTERFAGAPVVLGPPAPVFPEFQRALDYLAGKPAADSPTAAELVGALPGLAEVEAEKAAAFLKSSVQNSSVEVQIPGDSTKEQRTAFYALINRVGNPHLEARTTSPTTIRIQLKS